jgi:hypothetical protein
VQLRAMRRMRARRFCHAAEQGLAVIDPAHESGDENAVGIADTTPTEFTDGHITLRENLVRQFTIRYANLAMCTY